MSTRRHLQTRRQARECDAEELTVFGICLPRAASRRRMLRRTQTLIWRVAAESARPDWTLLAISYLASAAIVMVLRSAFD
jgi:hypothetical protein